jgi:hypothetical protein
MTTAAVDFAALWRMLAPFGLPAPVAEYRFCKAVEVDGGQFAPLGGRHNGDKDREKLNTAAALGWRVLRFSPRMLTDDPAGCVELAAAALALRSDPPAEEAEGAA